MCSSSPKSHIAERMSLASPQSPGSETMYEDNEQLGGESERQRGKLGPFHPERWPHSSHHNGANSYSIPGNWIFRRQRASETKDAFKDRVGCSLRFVLQLNEMQSLMDMQDPLAGWSGSAHTWPRPPALPSGPAFLQVSSRLYEPRAEQRTETYDHVKPLWLNPHHQFLSSHHLPFVLWQL